MNEFQRLLHNAASTACKKCNGNAYLGARVPLPGTSGVNTQSREVGEQCTECNGSGMRKR